MNNNQNNQVLAEEKKILAEEKEILKEIKEEEVKIKKAERRTLFMSIGVFVLVVGSVLGLLYWRYSSGRVYIENSQISAPEIDLGPTTPGVLQELYVHEGDIVPANTAVARVDNDLIKTTVGGLIIQVNNNIGTRVNPGAVVVVMIDPNELRVVGRLAEDKGLEQVQVGQRVQFTVDAFGGREFYGTVDEISPTSRETGVVFSISDKREVRDFNIKARFNVSEYPELKNGMSAKIWVLTK